MRINFLGYSGVVFINSGFMTWSFKKHTYTDALSAEKHALMRQTKGKRSCSKTSSTPPAKKDLSGSVGQVRSMAAGGWHFSAFFRGGVDGYVHRLAVQASQLLQMFDCHGNDDSRMVFLHINIA